MIQSILFQKLEGIATLITAVVLYASIDASWWLFALLLFAPDLSMAGYLVGNQTGQTIYNIAHTYALPLSLALLGFGLSFPLLITLALIWVAHIGLDRMMGYGLKEAQGFKYTHLGRL